jgi:hypothetical protein
VLRPGARRGAGRRPVPDSANGGHDDEAINRWSVEVTVGEYDGRTYAEAALHDDIGNRLVGVGRANVARDEPDVPEIGDEIAVGRALVDLGRRLLDTAGEDIASLTHESVCGHRHQQDRCEGVYPGPRPGAAPPPGGAHVRHDDP